jgi:hypothetical protein
MLAFVGCVIPTVILTAYEEPFRLTVFSRVEGTSPVFHKSTILLAYSYLLFPFLASITFEIVVLCVQWLS